MLPRPGVSVLTTLAMVGLNLTAAILVAAAVTVLVETPARRLLRAAKPASPDTDIQTELATTK